ncbi:prepilin-type N-terminal cleavage/methylation domain-containing protein [Pannus brasiliensis CCIBt3594]|uniref:Prepilin-type N-terminal cleavage/methylation domain-containing protein n=1 Tax=Pannus brasiliensis CCIBt3594 TaxID=1427578 RepID=A0AAW9QKW5_9CHRO
MYSRHLHFWLARYRSPSGKNGTEGFTLLEILIVTVFIGILAALAFPAYQRWIDKTRYANARTQMNCMAKDLQIYKLERGFFPADTSRNIPPDGITCFYTQNSGQVPFNSMYDYENYSASGGRYIQITFLGKNGQKEYPSNATLYTTPGFYDHGEDDLVFSLGIN